jgi:hypothetical protein
MDQRTTGRVVTHGLAEDAVARATNVVIDGQGRASYTFTTPEGSARVHLQFVDAVEFRTAPAHAAPVTHRFVKEVLRLRSPPSLLVRRDHFPFGFGKTRLEPGDWYLLSPHLIHRDERFWKQPDVFDPDRFLPGAPHGPADRTCCVPFGRAPKKCVGATIGTVQLMGLCHLLCTRYRLTVEHPENLTMALRFAPVPEDFRGRLALRWRNPLGVRSLSLRLGTPAKLSAIRNRRILSRLYAVLTSARSRSNRARAGLTWHGTVGGVGTGGYSRRRSE